MPPLSPQIKICGVPLLPNGKKKGAENETRTRDPNLGKVVLYQLSYFRLLLSYLKDHFASIFLKAGAKVLLFFDIRKFFNKKMQKKCNFLHF